MTDDEAADSRAAVPTAGARAGTSRSSHQ